MILGLKGQRSVLRPVSIQTQSLALRALRLDGNRAKQKRLRWQAANHGCHFFDRASYWLQAAANRMLSQSKRLRLARFPSKRNAIAFGCKPGFRVRVQQYGVGSNSVSAF